VDPIPDPLLLRKSGSAGNRNRDLWVCSSDHETTEAVCFNSSLTDKKILRLVTDNAVISLSVFIVVISSVSGTHVVHNHLE
jgi:hypothetical protein